MTALTLAMLGTFQAEHNGQKIQSFRMNKVQALLAYVASEPGAHAREELFTLLWPGMPERSARQNLRQTLYHLRTIVPGLPIRPDGKGSNGKEGKVSLLLANRQDIRLNQAADVYVDVVRFDKLIQSTLDHNHVDLLTCQKCRRDLEECTELYRGDFLADFYLDDSDDFEEWADRKRAGYRRKVLDALETLTTIHTRQKDYPEARGNAERQLQIDDLRESAYRQLMEIHALSGRREEAFATFERCRQILAEELGMAPSAKTTELYEKIQVGDVSFDVPLAQGVRGYDLQEEIDAGAYGAIHLAIQPGVGRQVAVKVIRRRYANDPEFIRRFEAEAHTVARLEHPFIVPLYDYWRDPDGAYLVMRYLKGGSLLASLESGAWELETTVKLLDQLSSALATAHSQGVVHRDIKPANILLDESGNAYLSDFGIAKDTAASAEMTATGTVVGTLDYVSPEQIKNEAVSAQSDIYSLGAVLYETLTGEKPFPDASMASLLHSHLNEPIPLAGASRPDIPPEVDVVLQKATAKRPTDRYASALEMAEAFRRAVGAPAAAPGEIGLPEVAEIYNPYKGLRAFQEGDADDFFGRDALVEALVARLGASGGGHAGRFLAVVGPSGSGKSSVVKAGLIPALRQGALPGSENWFVAEMIPGSHPLEELEQALWPVAVDPPPSLVEPMERDNRGLLRTLRRILPQDGDSGGHSQLLLVVDQFEELFTLVEDEARRDFFLDSLLAAIAAPNSPLRVVITLRADFYDRPLQFQPLGQLLKENTEIVLPLNQAELTWAVREPARRMGVRLEAGLAETIVSDVADQPGALPLLQFAMTELFERRQDHLMTQAAYGDIGGVPGALAGRAEAVYESLDSDGRESARQLFLRLVTLGEGVEDTRRRVLRSELEALGEEQLTISNQLLIANDSSPQLTINHSQLTIDNFGSARLLTFDYDPASRAPTVEVAHEALLREWPRLRGWLEESRSDVRMQRLLAEAAAEWSASEHDPGFLLREARLDQFAGWSEGSSVALTSQEREFLASSVAARKAREVEEEARRLRELETAQQLAATERQRAEEQARSAGQLRRRAAFLAGALVIAALLAVAAIFFARQSGINADEASANAAEAQDNADLAATREAEALANFELASTREAEALAEAEQRAMAEALSVEEASVRATAEAIAIQERETAEQQSDLATSRELAAAALVNLDRDPELSILLAMHALSVRHTIEAEEALHLAVQESRVRQVLLDTAGELPFGRLTLSPDGKHFFTSRLGGGAMWDLASGELLFTALEERFNEYLPDNLTEFWINKAEFSPDGSLLALPIEAWISDELLPGFISIVAADSGREILTFRADDGGLQDVTFNHDGSQLASASGLGSVRIWDVPATLAAGAGQELASFCCHDDWIWSVNFSPDETRIVTAGEEGAIKVWDIGSESELYAVEGFEPDDALYTPDGNYVVVAAVSELLILEATSGELHGTAPSPGTNFNELRFSPDGSRLAASNTDGIARIWEYADGELDPNPLLLNGHKTWVGGIAFSPDGRYLVTASQDGTARVWDVTLDGGSEFGAYAHDSPVRVLDVAFSPDGRWLASTGMDNTVKIWDVTSREERLTLRGHEDWIQRLAFHPDGRSLATSSSDGTARIWDTQSGEELLVIQAHELAPTFFTGAKDVAFSADGGRLATAGADEVAKVWDVSTGEELFTLAGHTGPVGAVEYSSDGRWLITAGFDGTIRVWDPVDGRHLWTLPGDELPIYGASFSPDSSRLIAAHDYGEAVIWSFPGPDASPDTQPEKVLGIQHNPEWVRGGDFGPGGDLLVIASSTFPSSVHDAHGGERLVTLGHVASAAAFSPDGRMIATAGADGTVRLFAANLEELLALAESRVTRVLTDEECRQYLHLESCPADS